MLFGAHDTELQSGTTLQCEVQRSIDAILHFEPRSFPGQSYPLRYFHFKIVDADVVVLIVVVVTGVVVQIVVVLSVVASLTASM